MKAGCILLLLALTITLAQCELLLNKDIIEYVNSNPGHGWRAVNSINESPFAKWTREEAENRLFIAAKHLPSNLVDKFMRASKQSAAMGQGMRLMNSDLPTNFTVDEKWPGCVHPIRNQGSCGSCYSFAASEVLSDRFCIASNKSINLVLSAQDLVSCSHLTFGCNGGMPQAVFWELQHNGIVPDDCMPYTSGSSGHGGSCPSSVSCYGKSFKLPDIRFKVKNYYHVGQYLESASGRAEAIQQELIKNGPVDALFSVFADFSHYKSGVYRWISGGFQGLHAVKVIGWGVENNTPYWLVANSWSSSWGDSGRFKILRGSDACGFELMVYAGEPDLNNVPVHFRK